MYAVIRTGGKAVPRRSRRHRPHRKDRARERHHRVLRSRRRLRRRGQVREDLGGAKVLASVVSEGRGDKILVFHFKRKKQYKKMQGHRQSFVEVKINEILVGGKSFKAEAK